MLLDSNKVLLNSNLLSLFLVVFCNNFHIYGAQVLNDGTSVMFLLLRK